MVLQELREFLLLSSEHPEEAFDFLDWMASEEAQILTNWGIEGNIMKLSMVNVFKQMKTEKI